MPADGDDAGSLIAVVQDHLIILSFARDESC